jgi:hypothetical protein
VRRKREIFTEKEQQAVFIETLQYLTFRQQEECKKYREIFLKTVFGNPPIKKERRGWILVYILY